MQDDKLVGNEITLVSSKDLQQMISGILQSKTMTVIQKFVKANGPKAFICRTCWEKNGKSHAYIITNKMDYYSDMSCPDYQKYCCIPKIRNSCTIVRTSKGKQFTEALTQIQNILSYLYKSFHVSFEQFVADFIKDESENWWLVNVKAFIIEEPKPDLAKIKMFLGNEEQSIDSSLMKSV